MPGSRAPDSRVIASIREQGDWCLRLGSPITAQFCMTLADVIAPVTATERRLLAWEGDLVKSAFVLRMAGAVHALARSGREPGLSALYRGEDGDWPAVLRAVLTRHDAWLRPWLDHPPQTNEVGRAAVLWAGLRVVAARFHQPIELLELGSSAGLNLNLDRFGYDLGRQRSGDRASPVQLAPVWHGPLPPPHSPIIAARRGVDLAPVDVRDPIAAERLVAFIWAGMTERLERTASAIAIAQAHPPRIDQADIVDWLRARLAEPIPDGHSRVVMHSITLQYLAPAARETVAALLAQAGAQATPTRPLAWVAMEADGVKHTPTLTVTMWPGGAARVYADVHPHGAEITWRA